MLIYCTGKCSDILFIYCTGKEVYKEVYVYILYREVY